MENDKLTIDVEANGLEQINETLQETVDNAQDLQEALDLPNVTIKWSKNCTFNITINKGDINAISE